MPMYAYQCTDCGAEEEHIQRFSDPPMTTCESCGGALQKQLSAAAFHLKGGGWYKDGYASQKPVSSDSKPDKASGAESKSSTKTSDGGAKAAAE